jgi:hypothetical protein
MRVVEPFGVLLTSGLRLVAGRLRRVWVALSSPALMPCPGAPCARSLRMT